MAGGAPNPKRKKRSRPVDADEAAFLNQAVKMGILDRVRVEEALDLQEARRNAGKEDPIAFILLETGYIQSEQIATVREAMKTAPPPPESSPPPSGAHTEYESEEDQAKREAIFAKVAVKLGFVSDTEIGECRAIQARSREKGRSDPLGFLLLEKGYVTSHQIRNINEEVRKTLGKPRIAGYELESELGRGAMGVVFRARQMSLDREVALKVIPKTILTDEDFKGRFFREARTAARLNHPNIVKAIDAGETPRHYFFAMELIEGETVLDEIRRKKRLPEKQALDYAIQVAKALQHAHKNGLVHRDIKPENLLLDAESKAVKVTDMGLAKSSEEQESSITREGATVGTPNYISPEQVSAKKDVDIRADIYALGGTIYHMLAGAPPFSAPTPILVIKKHLEEKPVSLKIRNNTVSAEMNRIVMKMLEKDKENRHADPTRLLEDLENLRRTGPNRTADRTGARPPTGAVRLGRRKQSFPLGPVIGIAAAVGIVLLLAAVFLGGSGSNPDDDGGKTRRSGDGGNTQEPVDPVVDTREERAQQALEKVNIFARENPDRFDAVIQMYGEVIDRFPRTAAYAAAKEAIRRAEDRKKSSVQKTLDTVLAEARRRAAEDRFKNALDALNEFPSSLRDDETENALRAAGDEIRKQAERACTEREARADALAAEGKTEEAVEVLRSVETFGMPGLTDKVRPKIERLEKEKKTSSFRELHIRVLDRIAASGLQGGRQLLEEELTKIEDYDLKDLLRADIVNIGKAEAVMASVLRNSASRGAIRPVRLKTGEVLLAEISAQGEELGLKGPEGERTVKVSELASPDVRDLARVSAHPMACYAWYVNRDLRFLLELAGGKTEGEGEIFPLVRLALNCLGFDVQTRMASLSSGAGADRFLPLLLAAGGLPVMDEMEDRARLLAAKSFAGASNPFVFAQGPGPSGPGEFRIQYDFLSPVPFHQFLAPGRGLWKAGWGSLNQSARKSGQIDAFLPGEWNRFRAEMEIFLEQPVEGVGFTFHRTGEGLCYALDIRSRKDELVSAFYFRPKGRPAMAMMGTPLILKQPDIGRFLKVSLTVRDGIFTADIDGRQIRCTPEDRRSADENGHNEIPSGRLGLRASSPVTVRSLTVEGAPTSRWLGALPGSETLEGLKNSGEGRLFDGLSSRGWETVAGSARVQAGAMRLEGPFSAVSHASGSMLDGRTDLQIRFQARRIAPGSMLLVGFRFRQMPRLVAVRPAAEDPWPGSLPPGVHVVDVPSASDGAWHQYDLLESPEGAALWVDRQKRYLVDAKDIVQWPHSRFHIWGFGIGAAGGSWEFKDVVMTRKKLD